MDQNLRSSQGKMTNEEQMFALSGRQPVNQNAVQDQVFALSGRQPNNQNAIQDQIFAQSGRQPVNQKGIQLYQKQGNIYNQPIQEELEAPSSGEYRQSNMQSPINGSVFNPQLGSRMMSPTFVPQPYIIKSELLQQNQILYEAPRFTQPLIDNKTENIVVGSQSDSTYQEKIQLCNQIRELENINKNQSLQDCIKYSQYDQIKEDLLQRNVDYGEFRNQINQKGGQQPMMDENPKILQAKPTQDNQKPLGQRLSNGQIPMQNYRGRNSQQMRKEESRSLFGCM